ncbi:MAG: rRNA adenine N-6-methyltransferase family protein, partial [Acidobacteriota bacterium]
MGRRFGQHFLARQSVLQHIAETACGEGTPLIIEIGPGRGALTEVLLQRAAR